MRHALVLCAALGLACSDNGPTGPTDPMAAIAGSWTLQSWELRYVGSPTNKLDMMEAGFAGTLVVHASGTFTVSLTLQNLPASTQTGTLTIRGDTLVYNTDDGVVLFKYTCLGGTMTWDTLVAEVGDIDGDEVPESFTEHMVFRRR